MTVETFEVNGNSIIDAAGRVDWNYVKNTPSISITNNNHSHANRYYTESEVNDRINSLDTALASLQDKVNAL
jgi:hypothetical protein